MKKVAIVGGGISGLTVAYTLQSRNRNLEITVFEAEPRAGGKIWTDKVKGFLCEKGPNGFLDNKPKTLELCNELGVSPLRANENSKKRYILSGGKLNVIPESPLAFIKSDVLSWGGKLRMLYELIAPKGPDDETVADFITRRLGKEALEKLIDPMVSGIFAGDPYKMSIKSCFPRIKELELEYGSLIRALVKIQRSKKRAGESRVSTMPGGTLTSFQDGIQVFTDALIERLGEKVKTGISVQGLEKIGDSYQLHTSEYIFDADIVVLASPAYATAEILRELDKELSKVISGIPYPPVSIVCFGYKKEKVQHSLSGFGFLIPHNERKKILGTLWDSSIFPNRAPEGYALLRSMIGGAQSPDLALLDDDKLLSVVFDELRSLLALKAEPEMVKIYRWERAIPQYLIGHPERLRLMDERLKSYYGLYLTGNAYRGVGMNDCIENGRKVADEIINISASY